MEGAGPQRELREQRVRPKVAAGGRWAAPGRGFPEEMAAQPAKPRAGLWEAPRPRAAAGLRGQGQEAQSQTRRWPVVRAC